MYGWLEFILFLLISRTLDLHNLLHALPWMGRVEGSGWRTYGSNHTMMPTGQKGMRLEGRVRYAVGLAGSLAEWGCGQKHKGTSCLACTRGVEVLIDKGLIHKIRRRYFCHSLCAGENAEMPGIAEVQYLLMNEEVRK